MLTFRAGELTVRAEYTIPEEGLIRPVSITGPPELVTAFERALEPARGLGHLIDAKYCFWGTAYEVASFAEDRGLCRCCQHLPA